MPVLKNARYERFVHNLIKGLPDGEAYTAAGYNSIGNVASACALKLKKNDEVKARYDELMVPMLKDSTDIRDLARQYTAEAIQVQVDIMRDRGVHASVRLAAALALHDRGHGKAVQHIEAEISVYDSLGLDEKEALLAILESLDPPDEETDSGRPAQTNH